jgi:Protein of unknown function (DUF3717)
LGGRIQLGVAQCALRADDRRWMWRRAARHCSRDSVARPLCYPFFESMEAITIGQLETAINRARVALPAHGTESALPPDVAVLATIYGRLIYERSDRVDLERLTDEEQVTLLRWLAG